MRLFPKEAWCYAFLLIILFAIASIAVWGILVYVEDEISGEPYQIVALGIGSIALGFMLIAGAFGLWAIRFSAESESLRRIGTLIDTMDYMSDGLIALDKKGRITGCNPAATLIAHSNVIIRNNYITDVFSCLSQEDVELMINMESPNEVEREFVHGNVSQTIRFRSQPAEGITMLIISDVTIMNAQIIRKRQAAQLQLIGQIARGVANDFNKLLSGISGHAAILGRLAPSSDNVDKSIAAIAHASERGVALAGHLIELTHSADSSIHNTNTAYEHVCDAVQTLHDNLPRGWCVDTAIQHLPAIGLTGNQIEQIVLNLAFIATDMSQVPGVLKIQASAPQTYRPFNIGAKFAGVLIITASSADLSSIIANLKEPDIEAGVILSVLQSMIEETGGALNYLIGTDGVPVFKVALPHGNPVLDADEASELPEEMGTYFTGWSILLAKESNEHFHLDNRLNELGIKFERVTSITSALAYVEEHTGLDAIIIDRRLLGQEARGLLKALLKLCPAIAIEVLCEDPSSESFKGLSSDITFVTTGAHTNRILLSLIEAKSLAVKRRSRKLV